MTDQTADNSAAAADTAGEIAAEVEFMSAERFVFFSDAVVAIAITLLALALPLPRHLTSDRTGPEVFQGMWADRSAYFAFLISFVVIGNHWRSHHRLFRNVARLDARIISINLVWLLMIVITPFATRLLSANADFGPRFTVYAVIQIITILAFLFMSRHIRGSRLLRPGAPPPATRVDDAALLAAVGMFALSIPVSFTTEWAFAFWVASAFAAKAARRYRSHDPR